MIINRCVEAIFSTFFQSVSSFFSIRFIFFLLLFFYPRNRLPLLLFYIPPNHIDIPTAHGRNPCGQEGKGHGLPRDPCDRNRTRHATIYCHTRYVQTTIQPLSFVYRPAILSRSARFTISPLRRISALLLLLSSALHGKRTANTCSEFPPLFDPCLPLPTLPSTSPEPSLPLCVFFFISSPSLPCYSRGCFRGACFASDYYLPRSESTAGLWYTGSMVSRYTPATATPSPRPLGGTRAFPRCFPLGPADGLPRSPISRRRSCYRVVLSPLSYPANRALPPLSRRLHVLFARLQGRINCRFIAIAFL